MSCVLMLGSGPTVLSARDWDRAPFDHIVAINNAFQVRPDWDFHIHPWDFPPNRIPQPQGQQRIITEDDFVPAQNDYGGFVYAGGTMAFTAAYWVLSAIKPAVIAVFGCDMHYPAGKTHFYGKGTADPLRADVTLRSLEAKSARLMVLAAMQGCAIVNLSDGPSRQVFPRRKLSGLKDCVPTTFDAGLAKAALQREAELGYLVPSGRYWEENTRFDLAALDALDVLWLQAAGVWQQPLAATA